MAKFNFKLDSVLRYKTQSVSNKMNELSTEITLLNSKIDDLDKIVMNLEDAKGSFHSNMSANVSVLDIQSHYSYMCNLNQAKKFKESDINNQISKIDNTRKELLNISREKKTLEILEEQTFEDFKKNLLKIEQMENDERNSYNHSKTIKLNQGE